MKRVLIIGAIILAVTTVAHADVTISGTQVTATMTEPTMNVENSDGVVTPLADLKQTRITYELNDPVLGGLGEEPCGDPMPATQPSGGGEVSVSCVVPVKQNSEQDVTFRGYADDMSGNVSDPTPDLIKRFDSLRSAAPTF